MTALVNSFDTALRERASRVVPGGMWGHLHAARLPDGYPQFFARAPRAAALWDVDGARLSSTSCAAGGRTCSAITIRRSRRRRRDSAASATA